MKPGSASWGARCPGPTPSRRSPAARATSPISPAGHAPRRAPALAARPRAHPLDRRDPGARRPRRPRRGHRRRPRVVRPVLRPRVPRSPHPGHRRRALRGRAGRRGGRRRRGGRGRGARADRGRVRGAARRHHARGGARPGRAARAHRRGRSPATSPTSRAWSPCRAPTSATSSTASAAGAPPPSPTPTSRSRRRYAFPRVQHYSMEPHAALAAWDEDGRPHRVGVHAESVLRARRAGEDVRPAALPHPHRRAAPRRRLRRQDLREARAHHRRARADRARGPCGWPSPPRTRSARCGAATRACASALGFAARRHALGGGMPRRLRRRRVRRHRAARSSRRARTPRPGPTACRTRFSTAAPSTRTPRPAAPSAGSACPSSRGRSSR